MTAVVSTPVPGKRSKPWNASTFDLTAVGYEEVELLLEGTVVGRPVPDATDTPAPYKTRVIVRRPVDPAGFSGRVVVEWMNVSAGVEIDISWPAVWPFIVREGWAYVGVCAQPVGLEHLRRWDPVRYGELVHPATPDGEMPRYLFGETYSDAIFTDVAEALAGAGATQLLGATPTLLLAHGQSQSSMRLADHLRTEHLRVPLFAGYLLHAGGAGRVTPKGLEMAALEMPDDATKVMHVNSEAEVGMFRPDALPEHPNYRYWEVAGSGHTPAATTVEFNARSGRPAPEPSVPYGPPTIEYALRTALAGLDRWIAGGEAPPAAPPVTTTRDADDKPVVTRDEHGNAVGGVRLPHIEAPLGRFLARHPDPGLELGGGFVPFDRDTLRRLYGSSDAYRAKVQAAAATAVAAGFLLPADAELVTAEAAAVEI